jgi:hypothetical protein
VLPGEKKELAGWSGDALHPSIPGVTVTSLWTVFTVKGFRLTPCC